MPKKSDQIKQAKESITRLYTDSCMTQWQPGDEIELESKQAHHAITVLRRKVGDSLALFDGDTTEWLTEIVTIKKRIATVSLVEPITPKAESPLHTHLGIALFRNERFDFAIQKAVELGITSITPLITDNVSIKQSRSHLEKREQHWRGVIISATEQSGRCFLPKLQPTTGLDSWINAQKSDLNLILHPYGNRQTVQTSFKETSSPPSSASITTGPEGGFTDREITEATQMGIKPILLGERILRAETAPLAILTLLQAQWGDF